MEVKINRGIRNYQEAMSTKLTLHFRKHELYFLLVY